MLALIAMQRHIAISILANPPSMAQHGIPDGGVPMTIWTNPGMSEQEPNLSMSIGQRVWVGSGLALGESVESGAAGRC